MSYTTLRIATVVVCAAALSPARAAAPPEAGGRPPSASERRLDDIERKLEVLLTEVQQIREGMEQEPRIEMVTLEHANAVLVAKVLDALMRPARVRIGVDERNNALFLRGSRAQIAEIKAMLVQLDREKKARAGSAPEELKRLEGNWKAVSFLAGGQSLMAEKRGEASARIEGDTFTIYVEGKQREQATMKIDPGKTPAQIDLTFTTEEGLPAVNRGIYRLSGDFLTVCVASAGKARPAAFESKIGSDTTLMVLKRVKE